MRARLGLPSPKDAAIDSIPLSSFACLLIEVQSCSDMSNDSDSDTSKEDARAFVEAVSRSKGTFTDAFKQKANLEAKNGREGMLQAIEGGEEIREDLVKALEM